LAMNPVLEADKLVKVVNGHLREITVDAIMS
jgi:hypothetical protein